MPGRGSSALSLGKKGLKFETERLVFIRENFFLGKGGILYGLSCHE